MANRTMLCVLIILLHMCSETLGDHRKDDDDKHSNVDLDHRLGDLFWTVFILAIFGFFIYLVCSYIGPEPPPQTCTPHQRREESVVNVRITNLAELLHTNGRALPPQSGSPA